MRISEVLSEAGEYEKGKSFASKLLSPDQWINPKAGGAYDKGTEFGKKLLSPTDWFKSNSSDEPEDEPEDDEPEKKTVEKPAAVDQDSVKRIIDEIVAGQPRYREDLDKLSRFRNDVINGSVSVNVDSDQLSNALKAIIDNEQLSQDQIKILKQYSS